MIMKHIRDRIKSVHETMQLIPASVIEQDLRLHAVRNQLAIILDDIEDNAVKMEMIDFSSETASIETIEEEFVLDDCIPPEYPETEFNEL